MIRAAITLPFIATMILAALLDLSSCHYAPAQTIGKGGFSKAQNIRCPSGYAPATTTDHRPRPICASGGTLAIATPVGALVRHFCNGAVLVYMDDGSAMCGADLREPQ